MMDTLEYRPFRCCMCPNINTPARTVCPPGGPAKKPETSCRFVKAYIDKRGWKYRVTGGIGGDNFKVQYQRTDKHGSDGWHGVSSLPRRADFDEAQVDLNAMAEKKGWMEYD